MAVSHSRTVLSSLPLASACPSGLKATLLTKSWWPVNWRSSLPLAVSHSRTVVVGAAAGQREPVGAEGHAPDGVLVAGELAQGFAGGRLPQPHRVVGAAAGQRVPVGAEGHAPDGGLVAGELAQGFAGGRLPQPHRVVVAAAGQREPVGAEGHAPYGGLVAGELAQGFAGGRLPQPDCAIGMAAGHQVQGGVPRDAGAWRGAAQEWKRPGVVRHRRAQQFAIGRKRRGALRGSEFGPAQVGAGELCALQLRAQEPRARKISLFQRGVGENGFSQVRADEFRSLEMGAAEVCFDKPRLGQVRAAKVCSHKRLVGKILSAQVLAGEVERNLHTETFQYFQGVGLGDVLVRSFACRYAARPSDGYFDGRPNRRETLPSTVTSPAWRAGRKRRFA